MNSHKRKVTDLLRSEAILISSDADLKVLEEFEKAGAMWYGNKTKPTNWNPSNHGFEYPFYLFYKNNQLSWSNASAGIPATDFIPTEAEKVEVDWKMIAEQLSAELEKVAEFFRTHNKPDNRFRSLVFEYIGFTEIAESVNQTLLLTRNPETK